MGPTNYWFVVLSLASIVGHLVQAGETLIKKIESSIPSFEDTPDTISIGILGSELTLELASHKFDVKALQSVIHKVFDYADLNADEQLDNKELALWLHKNEVVNQAVEIKGEFWEYDENQDSKITFKEFALHGGLDQGSVEDFKTNFLLENGELNTAALNYEHPMMKETGGINSAGIVSRLYQVFIAADIDKDGALTWHEFFVFSYPEDNDEVHMHATGRSHRKLDNNKDNKYDLEEFTELFKSHISIPELLPKEYSTPELMFKACDKDKDSFMTYEESDSCLKGHAYIAIDYQEPEWLIEDGDKNGDQMLSKQEIIDEFHNLTEHDEYWLWLEKKEEL